MPPEMPREARASLVTQNKTLTKAAAHIHEWDTSECVCVCVCVSESVGSTLRLHVNVHPNNDSHTPTYVTNNVNLPNSTKQT